METRSWWICSECDYVLQAETPPKVCPQCAKPCLFSDVTCYVPECGGQSNLDVRLVAAKNAEAKKTKNL
jgi:rubredoxin